MNVTYLPAICVFFPMIAGLLLFAQDRRPNVRDGISIVISIILLALILPLYPQVLSGQLPEITLASPVSGLSIAFRVDSLGLLFATIASGLWVVTTIYAIGYMRATNEKSQTRFFYFFALSIGAAIGVAFSANLLTLFFFYETLTLATYPLVTHKRTADAVSGGRTYLGMLLFTSVGFLVTAIIWTYSLSGTLDFTPGGILAGKVEGGLLVLLLALYVFGIGKAALMPFHRWLPAAMVAPTPVSALLHAVAVVKAGVFAITKVIVYVFGTDFLTESGAANLLIQVAAFTILASSVIALSKDSIKARLAYSTVGQLAYVTLGALLASTSGMVGAVMQIAAHAVGKITLFFCAGAVYAAHRLTLVSQLDGIGRKMPYTFGAFAVGAISITGLPPMVGVWSKWYLLQGTIETGQWFALMALIGSSLLNVVYLLGIVARAFWAPASTEHPVQIEEAPMLCVLALCVTAALTLGLFFYVDAIDALIIRLPIGGH